jgi:hypothetical protein
MILRNNVYKVVQQSFGYSLEQTSVMRCFLPCVSSTSLVSLSVLNRVVHCLILVKALDLQ